MPTIALTDDTVATLRCPPSKRVELYRDSVLKGLAIQVTRPGPRGSGTASYVAQFKDGDATRQTVLGSVHELSLDTAREEAVMALRKMRAEYAQVANARGKGSLAAVFDSYIDAKNIEAHNARKYRQVLQVYGGPLWTMSADSIDASHVIAQRKAVVSGSFAEWHRKQGTTELKAKGGPRAANDLAQYGSMVMAWHLGNNSGKRNPFAGIDALPTPEGGPAYVFDPRELPAVARFVDRLDADHRVMFWLLMMTGARPLGISRMRWDRLDLDAGTYKLTRDKAECAGWKPATSPEWDYPLDTYSVSLLRAHALFKREGAIYLFGSPLWKRRDQPISTTPMLVIFKALREQCALSADCTPYAARYTRATYTEVLFGQTLLTQRMLHHESNWGKGQTLNGERLGATPGYIKTVTEQVRPYVQAYADAVLELCEVQPMTEQVRRVFLEGEALTIQQRHELVLNAGTPSVLATTPLPATAAETAPA